MMDNHLTSSDGTHSSRLAFGAMQFGGTADTAAASEMFAACVDAGINHFDTANVYNSGKSEEMLRKLAAPIRDKLIISSKIGYTGGSGASNIKSQFADTRRRLGTEAVDILYLHRFDPDTPLEETFSTLASFQSKGHIRYIGASNFAAWQVMKAQNAAHACGTRIDIVQPMYSLVKRQAEVELLPMCEDQRISVASYSPLGSGLLTGKYNRASPTGRLASDSRYAARYAQAWMHETAKALNSLAKDMSVSPITLAVAWAKTHPSFPCPIISARDVQQLRPSLAALDFEMTPELRDRISALSLTPPPATDRIEEA